MKATLFLICIMLCILSTGMAQTGKIKSTDAYDNMHIEKQLRNRIKYSLIHDAPVVDGASKKILRGDVLDVGRRKVAPYPQEQFLKSLNFDKSIAIN